MKKIKLKREAFLVAPFITDLFALGVNSPGGIVLTELLKQDGGKSAIDRITSYFDASTEPMSEFLHFIGCEDFENIEPNKIKALSVALSMDSNNDLCLDVPFKGEGVDILNSALTLNALGLKNQSDRLVKIGIKMTIENIFNDALASISNREIISKSQSERAKKPRNAYYQEIMEVIRLTWLTYPCASKTGIIEELMVQYHKKVTRGSLDNWIESSGLRPPRPKKYTSFELVYPQ
ncbi:hypothetical protein [Citrobacter portucalensis]|uniref:hypothetical protein n=1 Tax=Citrobacter portucalensis TaxID=1639133 RepID=UPI002162D769|nr:hypothetical protein [Citrobacter portucalensis]MCS0536123.1 hypothetical protein [Citrobacter portucalensis]